MLPMSIRFMRKLYILYSRKAESFIFGDSTSDVGTNNDVSYCTTRADYPPYGIDYPGSIPTGRFSNGYIPVDFICKLLGFSKSPAPYMYSSSHGSDFRRGVNFASGGSRLLKRNGLGGHIVPVVEQIEQFGNVYTSLKASMGDQWSFDYFISKSIYIFSFGSNDIFANFVNYKTVLSKEPFINAMMTAYEDTVKPGQSS